MKRRHSTSLRPAFALLLFLCIGLGANAQDSAQAEDAAPAEQELQDRISQIGTETLGDLTLDELLELSELYARFEAEQRFLKSADFSTYFLSGLGHFMAGDTLGGIIFLVGDLGISAGTILGAHALLPVSLQVQNMNYFDTSYTEIETAWQSQNFKSMLPAIGVAALGAILQQVYRGIAANHARQQAERALRRGQIHLTVEPAEARLGRLLGFGGPFGLAENHQE